MDVISTVQVKVSFLEDLRRFSLLRDASFQQLQDNIRTFCNIDPKVDIAIKYMDDDKDLITMSSDAEFREVLKSVPQGSILRLYANVKAATFPEIPITLTKPSAPPLQDNTSTLTLGGPPPAGGFSRASVQASLSNPLIEGDLEDLSLRTGAASLDPTAQQAPPPPFAPYGPPPFAGFPGGPGGFGPHRGGHGPHRGGFGPHRGGGFPGSPAGPQQYFGPQGGFGPHRGGFHHPHPHMRFAHPHPYGGPQDAAFGVAAPPPGATEEERKQWKEEQKNHWRTQRQAWKENWRHHGKQDREAFKEHKKEMKRHWKAEMDAAYARRSGTKLVARHVKDVTIADGTELPPSTPFVKTWKLRNEGEGAWPAGSRLLFISRKGDRMGGPDSVAIAAEGVAVEPGQEVEISVNLVAPSEPGRYTSYYKLVTPEGVKFGQRLWVSIVVSGTTSSSSSSSSDEDKKETKYGPTADMIQAMGFDVKRKHIVRLLAKHENNADRVVSILTKKDKGYHRKDKGHKKDKH